MLKLYEFDTVPETDAEILENLSEAEEVCVTKAINEDYTLTFLYPSLLIKATEIKINRLVECEGEFYRIMSITNGSKKNGMLSISCLHIFDADSRTIHIPSTGGDVCGAIPEYFLRDIFYNEDKTPKTSITMFDTKELTQRQKVSYNARIRRVGMQWFDNGGFSMDFFNLDKTSPYSIIRQVIENCGFGEIYRENTRFAIVKQLGVQATDYTPLLSLRTNLSALSVERDIKDIVNRLYVYGSDDASIKTATVNGSEYGLPYIDSTDSILRFGVKEGYKDYSDYKDANALYKLGAWEFDADNPDRIDKESINIEASLVDLSKLLKFGTLQNLDLGDAVIVEDETGARFRERIIRMQYYPYDFEQTSVTIGRVRKDLMFYINRMEKQIRNMVK